MRALVLIVCISISSLISAQESYDLLFIKGEYNQILTNSKSLEKPIDYYWNAMMLDQKGQTIQAIEILRVGLSKYSKNQMLEMKLAQF